MRGFGGISQQTGGLSCFQPACAHDCLQGADIIECDIVLTKDCVPICRHEPELITTTDALTKFPQLRRNFTVDANLFGSVRPRLAMQAAPCSR